MDIVEAYAEVLVGLMILAISAFMIFDHIVEPAFEQISINQSARADKSATFTMSINEGLGVHDQKVGRTPGVDPEVGYTRKDSGMSRMYFRPEQFIMLPSVDTDIASNPNLDLGTRRNVVSSEYNLTGTAVSTIAHRGLVIGQDSFSLERDYFMSRDALYDKQLTYDSINSSDLLETLRDMAVYPSNTFGSQIPESDMTYGGFNLTVDSTIDPVSKKISNSVIFVTGRVPTK